MRMDSDPEVTKFIVGPWSDALAHRAFIEARTMETYPTGQGYWTLRPRADPRQFLGWVFLIPLDSVGRDVEIGWRLPKAHWGNGYAAEAAAAVLTRGFSRGDIDRAVAEIHHGNRNSQRLAEKLGFTFHEERLHHGERHLRYVIDQTLMQSARIGGRCEDG